MWPSFTCGIKIKLKTCFRLRTADWHTPALSHRSLLNEMPLSTCFTWENSCLRTSLKRTGDVRGLRNAHVQWKMLQFTKACLRLWAYSYSNSADTNEGRCPVITWKGDLCQDEVWCLWLQEEVFKKWKCLSYTKGRSIKLWSTWESNVSLHTREHLENVSEDLPEHLLKRQSNQTAETSALLLQLAHHFLH